jgi:hypothetical protein
MSKTELEEFSQREIDNKIESSHKKIKNILNENFKEVLESIEAPVIIPLTKQNQDQMMENPLDRPENRYLGMNEDHFHSNEDVNLRLKDNPLAHRVLSEGRLDISSKDIDVAALSDSLLDNFVDSKDPSLTQISLGKVKSLQKDSIALEDVDVENIPKHLNIDIHGEHKEVLIIGQKVLDEDQSEILDEHLLDKDIFIEKSFEEVKKSTLGEVERLFFIENLNNKIRSYILYIPLFVFIYFYMKYYKEFSSCVQSVYLIDQEQLQILKQLKIQSSKN